MYDSLINSKHSKIGVCVCKSKFCVVQSKINVMYIDVKVSFGPNLVRSMYPLEEVYLYVSII